jgi:hypothetical protein
MNEIMKEVEKFVQRYYDLEIIIPSDSRKVKMTSGGFFPDILSDAISDYIRTKGQKLSVIEEKADQLFYWINKAYSYGLIQPGTNLLRKLEDCRRKNNETTKDLEICLANYSALERKHQHLVNILEKNLGSDWKKLEVQQKGESDNQL